MPERKTKGYFFSGQPINSNDKFLRQNIPTETTMRELLNSTAFIRDAEDGASPTQQGLIKYYLNDDAIDKRNKGQLAQGNIHSLLPTQAPGTGVDNAGYKESNPLSSALSTPVTGNGIQITGMIYEDAINGIKRVGHAVAFNGKSLPEAVPPNIVPVHIIAYDPTTDKDIRFSFIKDDYKDANYEKQFTSSLRWVVDHKLGKYPSVTLLDNTLKEFVADIQHTNKNQLIVTMRSGPTTGWCICN